ncbi:MAG TPA: DUF362 domain-containing protein [Vicinamibacterales bacterium]|nr:DUF362 domain-containing protein [Vicinamibacterales bacterium]
MSAPVEHRLSRRDFITTLSVPLLAVGCGQPFDPQRFHVPSSSTVGLFPAGSYEADFADLIFRGLGELGIRLAGRRVFLKPNMVEYELGTAINTHPQVVAGAAIACQRAGASEVVVGEGPGHRRDIEYLLSSTGLADQLREQRIKFVDLNHDDVAIVPLQSWFTGLRELALPVTLLESDFVISMPKLKTHHWAGMTCSMKNLFGTVPGAVYGWPKNPLHIHGIPNSILDLTATIRPHLAIVDGVTAMEGDGPIMGRPRKLGFVAMGSDLVAVDATCARVIGLDPEKIEYLKQAARFLGVIDAERIEHRGELPARYATRFDVVPALESLRLPR